MKIISRTDAKDQGLKRYFTGKPCPHGHIAEKLVSNWTCLECVKSSKKESFKRNYTPVPRKPKMPDEERKRLKAICDKYYAENNKEKIASKKKEWVDANKERLVIKNKINYENNKEQHAARAKIYRENNKEQIASDKKKYREENIDSIKNKSKKYRENNKDAIALNKKVHREENIELYTAKSKAYREKNKDKLSKRKSIQKKNNRDKINKAYNERRRTNPVFKMSEQIRNMLHRVLKSSGLPKTNRTVKMTGYTGSKLKEHLESLWLDGMSWLNHSLKGWHIDHIRSIQSFLDAGITDPAVINALSNLQPLWAGDNMRKGAR